MYRPLTWLCCLFLCSTLFSNQPAVIAQQDPPVVTEQEEAAPDPPVDEFQLAELPPLKRLVLYNSGVGHLQHTGEVDGKTRLQIRFGRHDVNDVLKSLVFEDRGGGTVRAVQYQPAPEPEDVAASQIGVPMTLAQLLQRFRGEGLRITVAGNEIRGTIYGVENRSSGNHVIETLVLINENGLQSIELPSVDLAQFDNVEVRENLQQAMAGVIKSRRANQKQLDLLLDGEGTREVQFAYVVDMPIWRMTYRLAVEDDQATLQGWAHVDNVTGVDWEEVDLELRSGRPQAFHLNIFAPIMAERPDFGNSVFRFTRGLNLITQWFGVEPAGSDSGGGQSFGAGGGFGGGGFGGGGLGGRNRTDTGIDIASAFKAAATESRASQMVRYQLSESVNIGAGKSASLPVFSETLPVTLLSVYDDQDERPIVFRAIQLANNTEYPLIAGPISVLRAGDFVGDGAIDRLNVGAQTEVVYGIDSALEVKRSIGELEESLKSIRISDQDVNLVYSYQTKVVFSIANTDVESRKIRLQYRFAGSETPDVQLLSPEPEQVVDGLATFSLTVDAQSGEALEVELGREEKRGLALGDVHAAQVKSWRDSQADMLNEDGQFLDELIGLQTSIQDWNSQIAALATRKRDLGSEQSRVRDNLEAVGSTSEAAKFYIDQLQGLENEIQQVNAETTAAQAELNGVINRKAARIREYGGD